MSRLPPRRHRFSPHRGPQEAKFSSYCLRFNGATQYVQIGDHISQRPGNGSYRWKAWILPNLSQRFPIIDKYGASGYAIEVLTDGRIFFRWRDPTLGDQLAQSPLGGVVSLVWQQVGVVLDRTTNQVFFYVNGRNTNVYPYAPATDLSGGSTLYLGRSPWFGQWALGYIDEVQFISRAQTPREMYEEFLQGYGRLVPNSTLNMRMEEGSGLTAYDDSGFENNGSLLPVAAPPVWTRVAKYELLSEAGV